MNKPLLTIAIPTYNRGYYLRLSIDQLKKDCWLINNGTVELLISDDHSTDDTANIIENAISDGFGIAYYKNKKNLGLDGNVAKCINLAKGKYILILGDDDLFIDGSLKWLLSTLEEKEYGVVSMRAYGYEKNFKMEFPGHQGKEKEFTNVNDFLISIGPSVTFTSSCVFNKDLLGKFNAEDYIGSWLVHVPLILRSAMRAKYNLQSTHYRIAAKRNNSGGYDFIKVFVSNLGVFLDNIMSEEIPQKTISKFDRIMMVNYLPLYLLRQRIMGIEQSENIPLLKSRYKKSPYLWVWVLPIVTLPRSLGIIYGGITTVLGRILNGDLIRGLFFIKSRINRLWKIQD